MPKPQITLASLLLLAAAFPIWVFLVVEISPESLPMLIALTIAIRVGLFGGRRSAWTFSALLASAFLVALFAFLRLMGMHNSN